MNNTPPLNESDEALELLLREHLNAPAERLTPSSGFALSVMDAIHTQATEPPPIAFPWRRVLPGAMAILCALAAFVVFVPGTASGPLLGARASQLLASSTFTYGEVVLGSVLLAACVSIVAVAASFRLAGSSR